MCFENGGWYITKSGNWSNTVLQYSSIKFLKVLCATAIQIYMFRGLWGDM